jgi:G3E family GTPase
MCQPLPVILLTGFLGAGKTTLLNRLLSNGLAGRRAGVIVNDFGKLNIDARLVSGGDHPLLELAGGCVCCTLQMGLTEAIEALAARHDLDVLIIEASGISVTGALLHTLQLCQPANLITVGRVIAMIDARRYTQVLHSLPAIRDQVGRADLLILNHADEVDSATIADAQDRLRQENPSARIVVTQHADLPLEPLFTIAKAGTALEQPLPHGEPWHSYQATLSPGLPIDCVLKSLNALPEDVERVKGFAGDHLVQKAGSFEATSSRHDAPAAGDDDARNKLVIIARRPIESAIRAAFGDGSIVSLTSAILDGDAPRTHRH